MEQLFTEIAKDFSGKTFTKTDLLNKYQKNTFKEKMLVQHKNDIENYIKTKKNKSNTHAL